MKTAIVPLAGKGVRLGKIGQAIAKALVPYQGRPAVDHILEMFQAVSVENVILVVNWKKEGIISYLEDGSSFDISIAYVIQPEPKGIANAILRAEPFVSEGEFLVVLGDTILLPKDSLKILGGANQVLVTEVDDPTKHGMIECFEKETLIEELQRNNPLNTLELNLNRITEKPKQWDYWENGNLGVCGVYRFNHKIFDAIRNIEPNKSSKELEISDAINELIREGGVVKVRVFEGTYIDMGRFLQKT